MRFKIFFPLAALVLFAVVGCQKDGLETPVFIEKQYIPSGEVEATATVKSFLATVKGAGERTTFADTEVNEGRWVLTAAFNFEKNSNLVLNGKTSIKNYSIQIPNISANGVLKMEGSAMTTKYLDLTNQIQMEEVSGSKLAVGSDLKIMNVTSSFTTLSADIVFISTNIANNWQQSWIDAANEIRTTTQNNQNTNRGCINWLPDFRVLVASLSPAAGNFTPQCSPTSSNCMNSLVSDSGYQSYEYNFLPNDLAVASEIGQDAIDRYNNPTNGSIPEFPLILEHIDVGLYFGYNEDQNGLGYYSASLWVSRIWGAPYTFCM